MPSQAHPTYQTGSSGPIKYRLNVNYRMRYSNEVLPVSAYVNDQPFKLPSVGASEDKQYTAVDSDCTDHAFEVVTDAFIEDSETRLAPPRDSATLTDDEMAQKVDDLHLTKICRTRLVIQSPLLRKALSLMIRYYPSSSWLSDSSVVATVFEPYSVLLHHYHEIEEFVSHESNFTSGLDVDDTSTQIDRKKTVCDMTLLLDFLKPIYESAVKPAADLLEQDVPMVSFDMLWYLFRPGMDVWFQGTSSPYMAVVHRVEHERDHDQRKWSSNESSVLILHLWCLSTDGNRVARISLTHLFGRFANQVEVTSLGVCPASYWDATDQGARRQSTLATSQLLVEAIRGGSLHIHYDEPNNANGVAPGKMVLDFLRPRSDDIERTGIAWPRFDELIDSDPALENYDYIFLNDPELSKIKDEEADKATPSSQTITIPTRRTITRPVSAISDDSNRATVNYNPRPASGRVIIIPSVDPQKKAMLGTTQITEHQLLLMPYRVPAFSLNTKRWHAINTAYMSKVEPSDDSINNLVVSDSALKTIRALASRRDRNSAKTTWSADFIEGKGIGQIILLHGPPGVGKTYTVEAVAEWLKRPFLALTVADLGTVETSIEQQLTTWFDLAEAWNAVLLVDEADIFLEQRKNKDLYRNGLVTAFLRRMEYFKGLLFLTTNRVGQIDDAFISRVHVAIEYPALTPLYRSRIWKAFFAKLHTERKGKIKVSPRAQAYVLGREMELNGREIRNALQTAIALAEFEARTQEGEERDEMVTVEQGHFEDVLGMCERFHAYVGSIRREDEKKRASGRGDRNDYGD